MKIGTIGTGFIVEWFLTAVEHNENCECLAVFSRKEETGRTLADKFNVKKVYTNYDEMLNDEEIDFIYIASPNSLHYPYAKKALEAGKNVIGEKPFTSNVRECQDLIQLAKEKHLFLFEAITTIHLPNFKRLKERMNELGQLKMVQCNFSQYSRKYDQFLAGETPNVFTTKFSGGALMDINVYNINFIMGLFGKPKKVNYFANIAHNGIDTSGVLVFTYDGFYAEAVGCKDTKSKNMAQIQGEKGFIYIEGETSRCRKIEIHMYNTEDVEVLDEQEDITALYYEMKDFSKIVEDKDYEACYKLLDYSLSVCEVMEAARKDAGIVFDADKN